MSKVFRFFLIIEFATSIVAHPAEEVLEEFSLFYLIATMAAQSAAHLTTSNVEKPSIFELVASQSLDATFHPALKRIAMVKTFLFTLQLFYFISFFISVFGLGQPGTVSSVGEALR